MNKTLKILEIYAFIFSFLFLLSFSVNAQIGIVDSEAKVKPMLTALGTYHMGTPGNNVVND